MSAEGRTPSCGDRLLWPEDGYYQEHLCALAAGHEGRHQGQDGRWWPDQSGRRLSCGCTGTCPHSEYPEPVKGRVTT